MENPLGFPIPVDYTNCSVNDINSIINTGGPNNCLLNLPDPSTILSPAVCGNAILEGDEECDCGTIAVSHYI